MANVLRKRKETNNRTVFTITILFLLISTICLTINYSVNHSINWSLYPIGALIVIWATITPLLIMKKYKTLGLFTGLTISLISFLFLIQKLATVKGWAIPLALPIAGLSLLALAVTLLGFAHFKLNKFYMAALTVFLFGVIINFGVGVIVGRFLNENNVNDISRASSLSVSVILSLILIAIGYKKRNKTNAQHGV
jgi:membrane protein YdbS with pleckstrin-like domain